MAKTRQPQKRIMIADDDEDLVFVLSRQMEQSGYKVFTCTGGINLLDDLHKHSPALLLLDIAMRTLNGSELCRDIKNDPALNGTRILLMSGNHNIAEHAASCGADGYVAKPLSLAELKSIVSKYLE